MFAKKSLFLSLETMSCNDMIHLIILTPKSYVDSTYQRTYPYPARMD